MALFAKLHLGQSWGEQWPERVLAQNGTGTMRVYKPMGEIDFCEMSYVDGDGDVTFLQCSSCGIIGTYMHVTDNGWERIPRYCPECGRRVREL